MSLYRPTWQGQRYQHLHSFGKKEKEIENVYLSHVTSYMYLEVSFYFISLVCIHYDRNNMLWISNIPFYFARFKRRYLFINGRASRVHLWQHCYLVIGRLHTDTQPSTGRFIIIIFYSLPKYIYTMKQVLHYCSIFPT